MNKGIIGITLKHCLRQVIKPVLRDVPSFCTTKVVVIHLKIDQNPAILHTLFQLGGFKVIILRIERDHISISIFQRCAKYLGFCFYLIKLKFTKIIPWKQEPQKTYSSSPDFIGTAYLQYNLHASGRRPRVHLSSIFFIT